jgi:hypothetical protein
MLPACAAAHLRHSFAGPARAHIVLDPAPAYSWLRHAVRVAWWLPAHPRPAHCRYTEWVGGTYPEFQPFPWQAPSPGRRAKRGRRGSAAAPADAAAAADSDADGHWVYLKRLRHPVLHGWYLRQLAAWRKVSRTACMPGVPAG